MEERGKDAEAGKDWSSPWNEVEEDGMTKCEGADTASLAGPTLHHPRRPWSRHIQDPIQHPHRGISSRIAHPTRTLVIISFHRLPQCA
jgi:hypothetical protein